MVLPSGETALYFTENDWVEFSDWMFEKVMAFGMNVSAETAKPLLVEIEGLKTEAELLKKQANRERWLLYGLGAATVGCFTWAVIASLR